MIFEFGIGSFITAAAAMAALNLSIIFFVGGKGSSTKSFALLSLTSALWSVSMLFLAATPETSIKIGETIHRITYVLGMFTALACFYFSFIFSSDKNSSVLAPVSALLILLSIIFIPVILKTNIFFSGTQWMGYIESFKINMWAIQIGEIPFAFDIIFSFLFFFSLYFIYKKIKKIGIENPKEKKSYFAMFYILIIGFVPASIFSMILPSFGKYQLDWLGPASTIFFVLALAYSMMKYNHMNIRVAFTEILVLSGIGLLFVNIFI